MAWVTGRSLLLAAGEAAGHEARARRDGHEHGFSGWLMLPPVCTPGRSPGRRWGEAWPWSAVDLFVVHEVGDVHVAPDVVQEVVAALAVGVAVASVDDDGQASFAILAAMAAGARGRAAPERVGGEVLRVLAACPMPAASITSWGLLVHPLERRLPAFQDCEVAAARAPGRFAVS